jgi:hypothetical protein
MIVGMFALIFGMLHASAKANDIFLPSVNIRLSFLLFPFSPLLTVEVRTFDNVTIQGETNFAHTHGLNVKYYTHQAMERGYVFVGSAFVKNSLLREDTSLTSLLYGGYGYAHLLNATWVVDGRIGIGPTLNADRNSVYPVVKIGIGARL